MAEKIQFDLVSPERLLLSREVDMIIVPGTEGDLGVLPGHAPVISTLRPGVVEVVEESQDKRRIFVAGGFAEITPDRCIILAEEAVALADIERGAAEQELRLAQQDLADSADDAERQAAEKAVQRAQAILDALDTRPYG
jgi:F-type H+-transporting ATPase subunit epsilon